MYVWKFTKKCGSRRWLEFEAYIPLQKDRSKTEEHLWRNMTFWKDK